MPIAARTRTWPIARITIATGLQWADTVKRELPKLEFPSKKDAKSKVDKKQKESKAKRASKNNKVNQKIIPSPKRKSKERTYFSPWQLTFLLPDDKALRRAVYENYLRAGMVAYFEGNKNKAVQMFQNADEFDISLRKQMGVETGMKRMINIVRGKMDALTPEALLELAKDDRQKTGILLADLYLMMFDPDKAGPLYERIFYGHSPFPKPNAGVESYLLFRMGQVLEFQRKHAEAMEFLYRLYNPKYAQYPWTADGIFRIGTWTHNHTQDPTKAMKHWKYVFTKTPRHPEAERSLFYYGLCSLKLKDYGMAKKAFDEYLNRYPDSRWTKRVRNELLPQAMNRTKGK